MQESRKPTLTIGQILSMNLGFLGLQFSFGLQQGNMGPIYSFLGAEESQLPLLQLAGPITGLVLQPIVGALSDRTLSRFGRRTPYFLIGAIMCAVGLIFMPLSVSIMTAVMWLWILDAGNNITMEPYRAYVADRLNPEQRQTGFLTQSAFTGLAQMLAFLTPSVLVLMGMDRDWVDEHNIPYTVRTVFWVGAALSLATIIWSVMRVPELPLTDKERDWIAKQPKGFAATFVEIGSAMKEMPTPMRKLGIMMVFQWFAMSGYWGYVIYAISRSVYNTSDPTSDGFRQAVLTNGEMAAFYNGIAFLAAFAMVPVARRIGAGPLHALALAAGGISMFFLPGVTDKAMLFFVIVGVGVAWGSIMGNPYIILASSIPPERVGVYMGIFNMMIVVPMLLFAFIMASVNLGFVQIGLGFYDGMLGGDPRNVLRVSGACMFIAAIAVLWVREGWRSGDDLKVEPAGA
jgi:maltose/moltooligosaccharide transporter